MSRIALVWVLSACLVATGVAGCGATASSPGQPAGQDVADDPSIVPGTYTGTISCEQTQRQSGVSGVLVSEDSQSFTITRTFAPSGLPIRDGQEVFRGQVSVEEIGADVRTYTVQTIGQSVNAVEVGEDARREDCLCELGTDCADCTPIVSTGSREISYQVLDERRVRFSSLEQVAEENTGSPSLLVQCDGLLSR